MNLYNKMESVLLPPVICSSIKNERIKRDCKQSLLLIQKNEDHIIDTSDNSSISSYLQTTVRITDFDTTLDDLNAMICLKITNPNPPFSTIFNEYCFKN